MTLKIAKEKAVEYVSPYEVSPSAYGYPGIITASIPDTNLIGNKQKWLQISHHLKNILSYIDDSRENFKGVSYSNYYNRLEKLINTMK